MIGEDGSPRWTVYEQLSALRLLDLHSALPKSPIFYPAHWLASTPPSLESPHRMTMILLPSELPLKRRTA